MHVCGIVAEYDPFHTGHAYHIAQTRSVLGEDAGIVAVISGSWVQRADCAFVDKWTRARLALMGGADLVLELPLPYAISSAERFARGGVSVLAGTGVVTHLSFGSECGCVEPLRRLALCLDSPAYEEELRRVAGQGLSFAASRQAAAGALLGGELAALLSKPNNNLGVEYLRALRGLTRPILPVTVRRQGAGHNCLSSGAPPFLSATQLRLELARGNGSAVRPWLIPGAWELLGGPSGQASIGRVERAMLARIYTMTAADWAALPDSGAAEGLPQRLAAAGRQCTCLEQFFALAKTKRYSHARLRRLALWAFLGLTAADMPDAPPYLRVLGFHGRGRALLREMKQHASLPILTKPAHARRLPEPAKRLFALEVRAADLYGLCLPQVPPPGAEWRQNPVVWTE